MYMSEFYNSDHFCISHKKGLRSGHRLVHTVLALERVALGHKVLARLLNLDKSLQ